MKELIIIGAGNLGRITYEYALLSKDFNTEWNLKGFIDKSTNIEDDFFNVISIVDDYMPEENDLFICALPSVLERKSAIDLIESKGGKFINIIHPTANISPSVTLGYGNLIGAFTTISINSQIGNHVIIQDHCNIGHDSSIGDFSHLFVGNVISGYNRIANLVTLYTRCTLYPKVKIEAAAVIGAASVVMRTVKQGTTVIGNPAKKIE